MSDKIIEAAIAAATVDSVQDAPKAANDEVEQTPTETEASTEPTESPETDNEASKPVAEEWSPKARAAVSKRDKKIGRQTAEIATLKAELERFRSTQQPQQQASQSNQDGAPKESDYDDFGKFLIAQAKYELRQEQAKANAETQKVQQTQAQQQQLQAWVRERDKAIESQLQELVAKNDIPDLQNVISENADYLDDCPEHVLHAFYEAENAVVAFYNLSKEGKLDALSTMSPYKVAMEIAKAEAKRPVVNKVSSAPKPIAPVKGGGAGTKSLDNMSYQELKKALKF